MSYDLNVYCEVPLTDRALRRLVERGSELSAVIDKPSGRVVGGRDKRTRADLLTIDGPYRLELEDVVGSAKTPSTSRVLYALTGTSQNVHDLEIVRRFANRLATETSGEIVDLQTYEPSVAFESPASTNTQRRYLHVAWYRLRDGNQDFAEIYLRAARSLFPLAVPERFGTHEPFQGRLPRDGDEAFTTLYRQECGLSDLMMRGPAIERGTISGWSNDFWQRFHSIRLSLPLEKVVERARARGGLEEFFTTVARKSSSFFGFAEVNSSRLMTAVSPQHDGAWGGLPTSPQWMTWFGSDYAKLVRPYLASGEVTDYSDGIVHRWTVAPVTLDRLTPLLRRSSWVPPELLPTFEPMTRDVIEPARSMPAALRRPKPGTPEALRIEQNIARSREGLGPPR